MGQNTFSSKNDPYSQFFHDRLRILFIDMNSFFASVEQQINKKFRDRPIIVAPMLSDTTCAISVSYEARQFGIKTGTMVRDALRLCPHLAVVPAHHHAYVECHNALVEILHHHFVTFEVLSVDEMACHLSERFRTADSASTLAKKLKAHIKRELGSYLRCSIGIAPNVFLAKVASDCQKPDGLTIFEGDYTPILFQQNLTDLPGIAKRTEARLRSHDIYTVEDLWNASAQKLRAAWGSVLGERWYYMLRGNLLTDYGGHENSTKKSFSHSHVLPPTLRTIKGAQDILHRLVSKALKRLRADNQAAKRIFLGVTYRNRREFQKKYYWHVERTQYCYANDDLFWLPLVSQWTADLPDVPEHKPSKVSICFYDLTQATQIQAPFFEDRSRYTKLFQIIDRLYNDRGWRIDVARVFHLKREAPFRISFGQSLKGGLKD